MGRSRRELPLRLGPKLLEARTKLGLTQEQMAERLRQVKASMQGGHVAEYEKGRREPSLPILLEYARISGIPVDLFIDDDLEIPASLPSRLRKRWETR